MSYTRWGHPRTYSDGTSTCYSYWTSSTNRRYDYPFVIHDAARNEIEIPRADLLEIVGDVLRDGGIENHEEIVETLHTEFVKLDG